MNDKEFLMHIGMPKCASTSIQAALHACTGIDFAGLLPIGAVGRFWQGQGLSDLFDCELRFAGCQVEESRQTIAQFIQNSPKKKIVVSSENISLRFLPWDIPTWHKLRFLHTITPAKTRYLFVYKSPYKMLVSLYKEWVLLGYARSFETFCEEMGKLRQFSFFDDILLDSLLRKWDGLFSKQDLSVVYMESPSFAADLSAFFQERIELPAVPKNVSMSNEECELVLNFNRTNCDSDGFFDVLELHRIDRNWPDERKFANARKRKVRRSACAEILKYTQVNTVDYKIPKFVAEAILADLDRTLHRAHDSRVDRELMVRYMDEIQHKSGLERHDGECVHERS